MRREWKINARSLWMVTLIYLALPVAVFLCGWLHLPLALLVLASLAAGVWYSGKHVYEETPVVLPAWLAAALAAACLALCLYAGVGGYAYQDADYFKHNAMFADLFRQEWPVAYSFSRGGTQHPTALVYYLAYYLPPALVGKIAGWEAMRVAGVLWTASGLFITSLWCLRFSRGSLWGPVAFLAFGGLDIVGMLLGLKIRQWMPELWIEHLQMEWWAGFSFGSYPGHSNQLFWAPQHALPGWLITAAAVHRMRSLKTLDGCLLLAALAPLWSPLVALGLLPIGLAGLAANKFKGALAVPNMAALPLLAVSGLFFAARGVPELPFLPVPAGWNDLVPLKLASTFTLEVLPWALLLLIPCKARDKGWILVVSCILFLAALPFWRIGAFNDLMLRSSLPALATLSFLLLDRAGEASRTWRKSALAVLLAGSGGFAIDLYRHARFLGSGTKQIDFSSASAVPTIPATPDLSGLLSQYLGSPHSFFFRKLARPLPAVSDPVPYDQQAPPPGAIESQNRKQLELRHRFERGERTQEFLREYGTLCYYQGDLWEAILALETMVKLNPSDPNGRVNLAVLLASSGIEAFRTRAQAELDAARKLTSDPAAFDHATESLRRSLQGGP